MRDIELDELLIRQVSALVSETADVAGGDDPLSVEAHLYRTLAINCQEKAALAVSFAAFAKEKRKASKAANISNGTTTTESHGIAG